MKEIFNFAPGPSNTRENVRLMRAYTPTNPDIDESFVDVYKRTCDKFNKIISSSNSTYILCGEGILGLEAACASLTEEGDRVLVLDNGLYGEGFKDFVSMYGGNPYVYSVDDKRGIDVDALEEFLRGDSDFKYATVVHCDTPTSVINDVSKICPLLKKYNILTVVDSVSGMVGERLNVDDSGIDIVIGGSQKAISALPGLTLVSISEDAQAAMRDRRTPIRSFYANLRIWENYLEERYFPYTISANDIMSLEVALDNILDEGIEEILERHRVCAEYVRGRAVDMGLSLYLEDDFSNTVTAIKMPDGIHATDVTSEIFKKHNVLIATSLGPFKDSIIRIGHMGENANMKDLKYVMDLLAEEVEGWRL